MKEKIAALNLDVNMMSLLLKMFHKYQRVNRVDVLNYLIVYSIFELPFKIYKKNK